MCRFHQDFAKCFVWIATWHFWGSFSSRNSGLPRTVSEMYKPTRIPPKFLVLKRFAAPSHSGVPLVTSTLGWGQEMFYDGQANIQYLLAEQGGCCQPLAGQATNKFVSFFNAMKLFPLYSLSVISSRGIWGCRHTSRGTKLISYYTFSVGRNAAKDPTRST